MWKEIRYKERLVNYCPFCQLFVNCNFHYNYRFYFWYVCMPLSNLYHVCKILIPFWMIGLQGTWSVEFLASFMNPFIGNPFGSCKYWTCCVPCAVVAFA